MKTTNKRSAFSMIELVFVIVILGVLAAVAVPRFVATRTDAQVATARSDMAAAQKAIVAKVFADNIDTTASKPTDPNRPWGQGNEMNSWSEWIVEVAGLDGSRWGVALNPGGDILSSSVSTKWGQGGQGWCTVTTERDSVAPMGNVTQNTLGTGKSGKGMCAAVLGIATGANGKCGSGGFMIFNPSNAAMPFLNSATAGLQGGGNNDFCFSYSKSYASSGGMGNKVVPLASTGTIEF